MCQDLLAGCPDGQSVEPAADVVVQEFQAGQGVFDVIFVVKNTLHFQKAQLHGDQIPGEQETACVEQAYVVADVLQLAQVVGRDHGRQAAFFHIVGENALYRLTHDRIQPVECLIAEKVPGVGAESAQHGELFFHTAGIVLDPALGSQ